MKFLKFGLIFSAFALFAFACTQNAPTNTTANNATVNNTAANKTAVANTTPTAAAPAATPADELAAARDIFKQNCVGCHKEDGSGGEKVLDTGNKIKVPNYKSPGAMNATDDKLYDYIANGEENEMPAFKDRLTETQMRNLVKFIRREFQGK